MFPSIVGFFAALGFLELFLCGFFFVALLISVSMDRRGNWSQKWYVTTFGLFTLAVMAWPSLPTPIDVFTIALTKLRSWDFWVPVLQYIGVGLLYSVLEFTLAVRRLAKYFREQWLQFIDKKLPVMVMFEHGRQQEFKSLRELQLVCGTGQLEYDAVYKRQLQDFAYRSKEFLTLIVNEAGTEPVPKINRAELASSIGAWTTFWPAYACSLVLGDLLAEVWTSIANWFIHISGRFVRLSFADVFKL